MPSTLNNPLRLGLRQERVISPQCLVIFGASGDLTHRKLIPALFELYLQRRIPSEFGIGIIYQVFKLLHLKQLVLKIEQVITKALVLYGICSKII